jgi:hypothetical protein
MSRDKNQFDDVLATLVLMAQMNVGGWHDQNIDVFSQV